GARPARHRRRHLPPPDGECVMDDRIAVAVHEQAYASPSLPATGDRRSLPPPADDAACRDV
ncbi:MAG TPA: hypothetical protein VF422_00195, partial [Dokdonella sp.]